MYIRYIVYYKYNKSDVDMMAKDEKSRQLCYVFPALTFRTIVITGLNDRTVSCIRVYEDTP